MKNKIIILISILLILGACSKQDRNNGLPKKVRIGIIRVPNDKTVAISKSYFDEYFKEKGIETEFMFFDSGVAANQAFSSGSIDFAEMGHTNAVVALANDLPVNLIWIHEVLGSNEALVVKEDSNINEIKDLQGEKIATTFSSTSHLSLLKALEESGIDNKVQLLDMQTAEIVAAWERGDIKAAYSWEPGLSKLKETGKVLIDSATLAEQGVVTANVDLVHTEFAQAYPDLVSDYINALNKGVTLYKTNPHEAISAASSQLGISLEEAKHQMSGTIWLDTTDQISNKYLGTNKNPGQFHEVFKETAVFLREQGNINKDINIEEINAFINTTYIEKTVGEK